MEFKIGAGLACLGIAVGLGQWLVPQEKLSSKVRTGLIVIAFILGIAGLGLIGYELLPRNPVMPVTTIVDPATTVELTDIVLRPDLFKPADTTKIDVHFGNRGPQLARDVSFAILLTIRHSSITKRQEDEMFHDLLDNYKGAPPTDMTVGFSGYRTVQTPMLSKKEADDLQGENTRLYLLGFIRYQDKNGAHRYEFCRWLQPPKEGLHHTWHLCDGGHNRVIPGDSLRVKADS